MFFSCHSVLNNLSATFKEWCGIKLLLAPTEDYPSSLSPLDGKRHSSVLQILRQRNRLSDALCCECETKTKKQCVLTQQWKHPAPTHPPDGRGTFGKHGMVRTVHLGYCPDSGCGDWVQSCQTGISMICMSLCPVYCFLTLVFAALVPPGCFPHKQLKIPISFLHWSQC